LLIFTSDNGAPASHFNANAMSNFPLRFYTREFQKSERFQFRGQKGELWEGGVRGAAFVTGYGIKKTGYFNRRLIHATDWFPTLLSVAAQDQTKSM
jgi:arylsulfatase A-like enzyme